MNKSSLINQNVFTVKVVLNRGYQLNNSQDNITLQVGSLINLTFIDLFFFSFFQVSKDLQISTSFHYQLPALQ